MLFGAEVRLDGPELLVAQHGGERVEIGVGAQRGDGVEARVLANLGPMMAKWPLPAVLRTSEAGVPDQRLVAPASCRSRLARMAWPRRRPSRPADSCGTGCSVARPR